MSFIKEPSSSGDLNYSLKDLKIRTFNVIVTSWVSCTVEEVLRGEVKTVDHFNQQE